MRKGAKPRTHLFFTFIFYNNTENFTHSVEQSLAINYSIKMEVTKMNLRYAVWTPKNPTSWERDTVYAFLSLDEIEVAHMEASEEKIRELAY
jgi:hypothetical protein